MQSAGHQFAVSGSTLFRWDEKFFDELRDRDMFLPSSSGGTCSSEDSCIITVKSARMIILTTKIHALLVHI